MRLPLFWVTVRGESMWPELSSGKRYLASGWVHPQKGDTVVCRRPEMHGTPIVKRVVRREGSRLYLESAVSWGGSYSVGTEDVIGTLLPYGREISRLR